MAAERNLWQVGDLGSGHHTETVNMAAASRLNSHWVSDAAGCDEGGSCRRLAQLLLLLYLLLWLLDGGRERERGNKRGKTVTKVRVSKICRYSYYITHARARDFRHYIWVFGGDLVWGSLEGMNELLTRIGEECGKQRVEINTKTTIFLCVEQNRRWFSLYEPRHVTNTIAENADHRIEERNIRAFSLQTHKK